MLQHPAYFNVSKSTVAWISHKNDFGSLLHSRAHMMKVAETTDSLLNEHRENFQIGLIKLY